MFAMGTPADPAGSIAVAERLAEVTRVLTPLEVGHALNFVERPTVTREVYAPETYRRLQAVKTSYDPQERFRANHPVPPAGR